MLQRPANDYFVVGAEFVYDLTADTLLVFDLVFNDEVGTDVTPNFKATSSSA